MSRKDPTTRVTSTTHVIPDMETTPGTISIPLVAVGGTSPLVRSVTIHLNRRDALNPQVRLSESLPPCVTSATLQQLYEGSIDLSEPSFFKYAFILLVEINAELYAAGDVVTITDEETILRIPILHCTAKFVAPTGIRLCAKNSYSVAFPFRVHDSVTTRISRVDAPEGILVQFDNSRDADLHLIRVSTNANAISGTSGVLRVFPQNSALEPCNVQFVVD